MMNLRDIKDAVESGKTVHYANPAHVVVKDDKGQWLIKCDLNGWCVGLTEQDGKTINGNTRRFYIAD